MNERRTRLGVWGRILSAHKGATAAVAVLVGLAFLAAWIQVGRQLWLLSGVVLSFIPLAFVFLVMRRQQVLMGVRLAAERRVKAGIRPLANPEERLRGILDNVQVMAMALDAAGRVTYCNAYLLRATGWEREEVTGRDWVDTFVPIPLRKATHEALEAVLAQGGWDGTREYPVMTRDGRIREATWDHVVLRDASGAVTGIAGFGRDVTDQRQLEAQFRHVQKMEAVGQLAGGIAHDFNNLLQVIAGYAALVLADVSPGHPLHAEISEIRTAAERASDLVRQLLAFSRRQKLERRVIDLNEAVTNVLRMLRRLIGAHIELDFQPGYGLQPVFADVGHLEQVLVNLCVNARDAMPKGGRICITTANASLGREFVEQHGWGRPGEYVQLTVSDNGPGIPPELRDRVFEPFFTTKEVGKGTGLGLATVYGIVKQHEGLIDVASDVAEGATFRVFLPVAKPSDGEPATPPAQEQAGADEPAGRGTILLAEDEDLVRRLAVRVLEGAGYRVLVAGDGAEAIELIESRGAEIDLALLDVAMPKASGGDVGARLKALRPDVPVIFCSGHNRQAINDRWLSEPGADLLLKPYEPQQLLDRVRERLRAARVVH